MLGVAALGMFRCIFVFASPSGSSSPFAAFSALFWSREYSTTSVSTKYLGLYGTTGYPPAQSLMTDAQGHEGTVKILEIFYLRGPCNL